MAPREPSLREAWETEAGRWIAWTRRPGHDTFDRWHRDAFLRLLPAPGLRTLDLGSGEGRVSRVLRAGGHDVLGVEASPTLATAAHEADPSIPVVIGDAAALPLGDGVADLVVAFMSLHDIDDMPRAVAEIARVLVAGGVLCLAVVHPLNSAGSFPVRAADSPFVVEGSYLESHRYADDVQRDGLTMTFHSRHHPLEDYARALQDSGFLIEAMHEPAVPEDAIDDPAGRRWQRVPLFLHVRARRDRVER